MTRLRGGTPSGVAFRGLGGGRVKGFGVELGRGCVWCIYVNQTLLFSFNPLSLIFTTMSLPSESQLRHLFDSDAECVKLLRSVGAFYMEWSCPACDTPLLYQEQRFLFRCGTNNCNLEVPLRRHSFFSGRRASYATIMRVIYLWLAQSTPGTIQASTGRTSTFVGALLRDLRLHVGRALSEDDVKIGGPGIIVEIDETKMGKRKTHRGHRVEGVWVLGGVERTEARKMFAVAVPNRSAATLETIIDYHVRPGSIIYTDSWRGYLGLGQLNNYQHYMVNHSATFVDPTTGVHTNTIEGTWAAMKRRISARCRTKELVEEHLDEFIWRRLAHGRLWDAFLESLSRIHYE